MVVYATRVEDAYQVTALDFSYFFSSHQKKKEEKGRKETRPVVKVHVASIMKALHIYL